MVGFCAVPQQTPRAVIAPPPSFVIFPPLVAVFVVIADHVGRTRKLQDRARSAIDRMLGTITKPPTSTLNTPAPTLVTSSS